MNKKILPNNFKQQLKSSIKFSLIFFIFVSILAVCYDVFKEDLDPFLNKYAPMVTSVLKAGKQDFEKSMEVKK